MTKQRTGIAYLRLSKADRLADGSLSTAGIERQREAVTELAERHRVTIVRVIEENDTSANKGERAGFADLLHAVRSHEADTLLAYGLDRLARKRRDSAALVDAVQRAKIDILLVNGSDLATSTPAGAMLATILSSMAAMETDQMAMRLSAAYKQRALNGEHVPRQRTFGFQPGNLTHEPVEADLVQEAFRRVSDGDGISTIVDDWKQRGIVSTKGQPLTRQSLRVVLTNARYIARCQYFQVVRDEDGREVGKVLISDVPGKWEPIVDEAVFNRVQAILADPERRTTRLTVRHLLAGIAVCGECGAKCRSAKGAGGRVLIACREKGCLKVARTAAPVEAAISDLAVQRLASADPAAFATADPAASAEIEARDLEARIADLAGAYAAGTLPVTAFAAASTDLEARLQETRRRAAGSTRSPLHGMPVGSSLEAVQAAWDAADVAKRRRVVAALFTVTLQPVGKGRKAGPLVGVEIGAR